MELVADHVENREPGESGELSRNLHDLVVTEGEQD